MKKRGLLAVYLLFVFMIAGACKKSQKVNDDEQTLSFTGPNKNAANLTVRLIYLVPSDRELKQSYIDGAKNCIIALGPWYKSNLGSDKTFHINNDFIVETLQSSRNAAWFNANHGNSGSNPDFYFYQNTKNDIKALLGARYSENNYTYMVYVDAPGKTGAGALGFTAMPENDLQGLDGQLSEAIPRWIGGAAHELGHAFGLRHPANELRNALMWLGYITYPNCILQDTDKTILNASKFFY